MVLLVGVAIVFSYGLAFANEDEKELIRLQQVWCKAEIEKDAESLKKILTEDYVMVTSFSHVPFYQSVILEIPDNWSWKESYNVPLDELSQIVDSALLNGFSVAWAADNSELGFNFKKGMALAPAIIYGSHSRRAEEKWSSKTIDEKNEIIFNMKKPVEEISVNQANRQEAIDNYSTTDDHGMHIVGIAKDKREKKFYYVKNSWGTDNPYEGYLFVSDAYFKYKTISVMLHKDAIPKEIAAKLNL